MSDPRDVAVAVFLRFFEYDTQDYVDLQKKELVVDGRVSISEEERAALLVLLGPIFEENERRYKEHWTEILNEFLEKALKGDTPARERLSYYASTGDKEALRMLRENRLVAA